MVKPPTFTPEELKAIHWELSRVGWAGETFYDERKRVIRKLDEWFGEDKVHLTLKTR